MLNREWQRLEKRPSNLTGAFLLIRKNGSIFMQPKREGATPTLPKGLRIESIKEIIEV